MTTELEMVGSKCNKPIADFVYGHELMKIGPIIFLHIQGVPKNLVQIYCNLNRTAPGFLGHPVLQIHFLSSCCLFKKTSPVAEKTLINLLKKYMNRKD